LQPGEQFTHPLGLPLVVTTIEHVLAQFGEDRADHKGKRYEIRAFANPKATVAPGRVTCWPEAEAWSDGVQLVRQ
jgi:hypothetical protein